MNELLNAQNVTVVGVLLVAIVWLVRTNDKNVAKQEKQSDEKYNYILETSTREREESKIEINRMNLNCIKERDEYLQRLDKFDCSLKENTLVLKEVSEGVKEIKNVRIDIDNIKQDIKEIKDDLK